MITAINFTLFIYLAASILPAVMLMRYVYLNDRSDKEPTGLLLNLVFQGILAALTAIIIELLGQKILKNSGLTPGSGLYIVILSFFIIAVAEEGSKMFFLYRKTWNNPNFNYHFDGIIYAVFVSLGFAAFENVKYIFSYGLGVALPRALLAIPGHMSFAVLMGTFYGRARYNANRGETFKKRWNLLMAFLCSTFMHGLYDTCALIGSKGSATLFVIVISAVYVIVYYLVKLSSLKDYPIWKSLIPNLF